MINWAKYFDRIYCINFIQYTQRKKLVQYELDRVGILNSGIFEWQTTYNMNNDKILQNYIFNNHVNFKHYPNNNVNISLMLGHYKCMRDAYNKGYKKILILQDDVRFLKDLNFIQTILQNKPKNYNIILYDKMINLPKEIEQFNSINNFFDTFTNCFSAACYQLDRKGMETIMHLIEISPSAIDNYFLSSSKCFQNILYCCAHKNMAIQAITNDADNVKNHFGSIECYHNHFKILNIDINDYMILQDGAQFKYNEFIDMENNSIKYFNIYPLKISKTKTIQKLQNNYQNSINIFLSIHKEKINNLYFLLYSLQSNISAKINLYLLINTEITNQFINAINICPNINIKILPYVQIEQIYRNNIFNIIKLLIPSLLNDIDKLLYISEDYLLKNKGIEQFYNIDFENNYLAACEDINVFNINSIFSQQSVKKTKICKKLIDFYFNTDLFIYNLKKIREDDKDKQLIDLLNSSNFNNTNLDQDITLNYIFKNAIIQLNPLFNVQSRYDRNIAKKWGINSQNEFMYKSFFINYSDQIKKLVYNNQYKLTDSQHYFIQYYNFIVQEQLFNLRQNRENYITNNSTFLITKNKTQIFDFKKQLKEKVINIFIAISSDTVEKLIPLFYSLLKYSQSNFNIYVMIDQENIQSFKDVFSMFNNSRLNITLLDVKEINKQFGVKFKGKFMTNIRLLTPMLFPNLDKMLYLDYDVILSNKGIQQFYNIDFEDNYLAACEDYINLYNNLNYNKIDNKMYDNKSLSQFRIFRYLTNFYFNAGVLLFNLKKIREDGKDKQLIDLLKFGNINQIILNQLQKRNIEINFDPCIKCFDQSILNFVFRNKVLQINPIFNNSMINFPNFPIQISHKFLKDWKIRDLNYFIDNIVLIHYAGPKPWEIKKYTKRKNYLFIHERTFLKYEQLLKQRDCDDKLE